MNKSTTPSETSAMNPTELDRLETVAKAATPGADEWDTTEPASALWKSMKVENAAFIRAFNPHTVLRLIADLRKCVEALEHIESLTRNNSRIGGKDPVDCLTCEEVNANAYSCLSSLSTKVGGPDVP